MRRVCSVVCVLLGVVGVRPVLGDACQAGNNPEHEGCQAGPIEAGEVWRQGGTGPVYEGHAIDFGKSEDSDVDCCWSEEAWGDEGEDEFSCEWSIERSVGEEWVAVETGLEVDATHASWQTDGHEPGRYRVKMVTDDTPETGVADGDDAAAEPRYVEFEVIPPVVTNPYRADLATDFPEPGDVNLAHGWQSTCGHVDHLDNVTVRSVLCYDDQEDPHHLSHYGQNSFTNRWANPVLQGWSGEHGVAWYKHDMPYICVQNPAKYRSRPRHPRNSYCSASQAYQFAYAYPEPPSVQDEEAGWQTFLTVTIERRVEPSGDWWRYRITLTDPEGAVEHTFPVPPVGD